MKQNLVSVTQNVLNPPFINPHLPKMYRINRELFLYLTPKETVDLVRLEINEYTRRPKLNITPKPKKIRKENPWIIVPLETDWERGLNMYDMEKVK